MQHSRNMDFSFGKKNEMQETELVCEKTMSTIEEEERKI